MQYKCSGDEKAESVCNAGRKIPGRLHPMATPGVLRGAKSECDKSEWAARMVAEGHAGARWNGLDAMRMLHGPQRRDA